MKARALCSVLLVTAAGVAAAADRDPVSVSPGGHEVFRNVASSCPTFSWGMIDNAEVYELAVFEVREDKAPSSLAAAGAIALRARIPGSALSWTPSREQCLSRGRYSWSVRALGAGGFENWSEPLFFAVDEAVALVGGGEGTEEVAGFSEDELETAVLRILENYLEGQARGVAPAPQVGPPAAARPLGAPAIGINAPEALFSLTGASAALRSDTVSGGPTFAIAGVADAFGQAAIIASHTDGGTDLVLDAPETHGITSVPARLNENTMNKESAANTSFLFHNSGAGDLNLRVEGPITSHAASSFPTGGGHLTLIPFYKRLDGDGSRATIATNGTLSVFVQCLVGTGRTVEVIATNTVDGWFAVDYTGAGGSVARVASAEVVVMRFPFAGGTSGPWFNNNVDSFFAVAPSGAYLAGNGDTTALGVGAFGKDCIAAGTVTSLVR